MPDQAASDLVTLSFTLNGRPTTARAAPFASLADTLRERLGCTGTKIGCEAGDCGACTVLVDGEQVCACLVPSQRAAERVIWTVEGDGPAGLTLRLRHAFLAHGAAQCGICTPGMLMAATDLLAREAAPSPAAVADAIAGVLCRCTGYIKIVEAILDAAGGTSLLPTPVAATAAVGARLARVDGWSKVAGREVFGADWAPADALWLRVVRSPHRAARFTIGDLDRLIAATPGLAAILTHRDVP
jgi:aerobic-type carbon monoxide dehydrogenase small subunit (CoxS/CutS family)